MTTASSIAQRQHYTPNDDTNQYLKEIGYTDLLTRTEERTLMACIKAGERAQARREAGDMGIDVARGIEDGRQAYEHFANANLRLPVHIAAKYLRKGLPFMDLIQEGNIGMLTAIRKFDPSMELRFSTYATWWIRQAITRALAEQSRIIRLPVHLSESVRQLNREAAKMDHTPTRQELADILGWSLYQVDRAMETRRTVRSLDEPALSSYSAEGERYLANVIGTSVEDFSAEVAHQQLRMTLDAALDELPDRAGALMRYRFGFDIGEHRTLEETGRHFGMTRENARLIEKASIKALRVMCADMDLHAYLEA